LYDKNVILLIDICFVNKEELKKKVGQRIVELRSQKGWSQSDLARACNKDRQALEKSIRLFIHYWRLRRL